MPVNRDAMLKAMREGKSDEMDFIVNREKRTPGETISAQALDDLGDVVNGFIRARIMHHWEAKPGGTAAVGPGHIKAEVRITIDNEHIVPTDDERPWYVIDGIHRAGGLVQ